MQQGAAASLENNAGAILPVPLPGINIYFQFFRVPGRGC
jgi:hypothetical protein